MRSMIVLNTKTELVELLDTTNMDTFVGNVAFAMDLLEMVRANDNIIQIDENLVRCDDGGWIEIDEDGYVVNDFAI